MKSQLLDVISSNSRTMYASQAVTIVALFGLMHLLLIACMPGNDKSVRTITLFSAAAAIATFFIVTLINAYMLQPQFNQGDAPVGFDEMYPAYNVITFVYSLAAFFLQRKLFISYLRTRTSPVTVVTTTKH